ncbi:hypothetical protein INT46_003755 [Mucor plumbeus]|uniref:Tc1-like transposase DDE domain-containing protein n=1 Tax=Mucor plumbeus TaxID=97098 RepID=A0A8H7UY76_9FUNG|nr:hypothetical protein INT46_003755 [Mucor plumbeus]
MSLRGIRYLLKSEGFQAKRKIKTNFVNASNKRKRIAWDRNHQHYTADDWGKWGFSKETRINMWSSVGKSYYWTDGATELLPHQIEPHVQGDGGSVLFWGLITEEGPGYGSTITEGDVSTEQHNATPHTSVPTKQRFQRQKLSLKFVFDWLPQNLDLNPIEHVWNQLKRRLSAYPAKATTIAELETRIHQE